jgi:lipoyl-dependent peroxiredoxin subunit D
MQLHFNDLQKTFDHSMSSDLLTKEQKWSVVLASAITSKEKNLIKMTLKNAKDHLSEAYIKAAETSASVMSMNNVYWRFWYLVDDNDYRDNALPLSQDNIKKFEIPKTDFECMHLAVSVINICAGCLKFHSKALLNLGFTKQQVLEVIRLASSIYGMSVASSLKSI